MRNFSESHVLLVNQAKMLGKYCYEHKFKGIEIMKGVKVSCVKRLYGDCGKDWLWTVMDSMLPDGFDKSDFCDFSPAVFLLGMQYHLQKDRSESSMRKVNGDFLDNCIICAKEHYGFLNPKRYRAIRTAKELHARVESGCQAFWNGIPSVDGDQ